MRAFIYNVKDHLHTCFIHNDIFWKPIPLKKGERYVGVKYDRYDGDYYSFGFWFYDIASFPRGLKKYLKKK